MDEKPMSAEALVLQFFQNWGPTRAHAKQSFRDFFTQETVWENVGVATTVGIEEALALFDAFPVTFDYISVDTLSIASAADGAVLTERIDHFHRADGTIVLSLRLMGIFVTEGTKILHWRDYFDPGALSTS